MSDRDTWSEAWRHECECLAWLKRGYTNKSKVAKLRNLLTLHRGAEEAERVIIGMRKEYAKQKLKKER